MSTPMMKQYQEIKARYPDAVLFYRMGDFYEMFFEDAVLTSQVLGLTLTKRNHGRETGDVPLAGFPHHQLENYLSKMTSAGHRVAVCDQLEDPKLAKGVVKRDVTEVVSAGTTFSVSMLEERRNNYLAAVWIDESQCGLAYADVTAQEFFTGVLPARELKARLLSLEPAEVLCAQEDVESVRAMVSALKQCTVTPTPRWQFAEDSAERTLTGHLGVANLKGFGLTQMQPAIRAAGALLFYVKSLHMDSNALLPDLRVFSDGAELTLDPGTKRNLELVESLTGNREATLLHVMDRTRTAAGGRLLRRWLLSPLRDIRGINERLDAIAFFVADPVLLANLTEKLKATADLQRLLSKLSTRRASPRDAVAIRRTLEQLPRIAKLFDLKSAEQLTAQLATLKQPRDLVELISAVLVEDPPLAVGDGSAIREGYSIDLDELRHIGSRARAWMQEHQTAQRNRTGIQTLKIGYNRVFGYYIEITNAHKERIPADYIRKQTLTNAERYVTPDLKAWEEKILNADERIQRIEEEIWEKLRQELVDRTSELTTIARALAELDVLSSLAVLAREERWTRPQVTDSARLNIMQGRHPVVEKLLAANSGFVANDLDIGTDNRQIMVLTGPNMAGKSTYLRQNALIVLIAQMGSFVPAQDAEIGIVDRVFTRIGAGDNLAGGESTFLVEMTEVANILRNATHRSLIILDEVGRGTSTYDGLSLAWAITEYLHDTPEVAAKTLFATHYHELNRMAGSFPRIFNTRVEVEEWGNRVVFLHRISSGETDRSYGIEVAKLAGLPQRIVKRASEMLPKWEEKQSKLTSDIAPDPAPTLQLTLFESDTQRVADALRSLTLDDLSPRQALDKLYEIKNLVEQGQSANSQNSP